MNMRKIIAIAAAVVMASGVYVGAPIDMESASPLAITAEAATKDKTEKTAAPTNFKAKKTSNSITLSWSAVDGADMYRVYKYNPKTQKYEKYKDVKSAKCTIKKLSAKTKYKFKVVSYAKNKDGKYVKGKSSKAVSVTTAAVKEESAKPPKSVDNVKLVGNDTAGYITTYYDYTYTESDNGSFSIVSDDGKDRTDVLVYDDIQADDQTAYMLCYTAVMSAYEDGFEVYNMFSGKTDGMNGYFAVVTDDDKGTGFKLYLALVDEKNNMIRVLRHESTRYTSDNIVAATEAFDSYRLKKS